MKYIKPINEIWGTDVKTDLPGKTIKKNKFHSIEEIREYLKSEIERQGENVVIRNLDVSPIDYLSELFKDIADGVKTLDLSGWKTSNVWSMSGMFSNCKNLTSLDLSGWDTSNVWNMDWMFSDCESLKSLDLSGWDTSSVKNMNYMFGKCKSLESLDLSGWNTSNVENMGQMFYLCSNLESLDLSGWDTSSVKNMSELFFRCPAPYKVVGNKIVKK